MQFIGFLVIGLVAGWLAQQIMKGSGGGLIVNLVIGIIGAYIGGFLFGYLGWFMHGFIGSLVSATVGAVVLLFILGLLKRS
ncbi:MAG: hypothetical protein QG577_528 [Thermodesulfobacteriota bacterium]|nr:hypothetical protein [Thermodesulfobacteriota bacterium]